VTSTRRLGSVAAVVVALGLVASGCTSSKNTATPAKSAPSASTNQMNPHARGDLQDGGKLTWPIDSAPANFNYNELDGTELNTSWITNVLLPQPFHFDAGATPTYNPDYLTGEPTVKTDPQQVVTYELNQKAVWEDGTPVSAADYVAQWNALKDANSKSYKLSSSTGYDQIQTVAQGKDQYEVVVTFAHKYGDWKALFSPLYPASTNSNPDVFNNGWIKQPLTTAGPFKFQSADATAKTYTLVRNPKWWGNQAKLDTIVYRVLDDDAMPESLANGEIDLQDSGPSVAYYQKDKQIAGLDERTAGGPNYRHIQMNGTSPELTDQNVRQAIAMGINRDQIAKAMIGPLGVPGVALNNHIFMENQNGYQDNASAVVGYNPTKAKSMLDAAGWTVSGTKRVKNGQTLKINFVIPSGVSTSQQESTLIQNMLAQVGVEVDINTVPTDDFFVKYITPGKYDMTVYSFIGTQFPISSSKSIFQKPQGDQIFQNYSRIGTDEIDQAFDAATAELDPAAAIAKANQIDTLLWQEAGMLTDYQRPDKWFVKKSLANFGAYGFADIHYEDIGWLKAGSS
jgi:peptide/nickel transport system substrate-binding protein